MALIPVLYDGWPFVRAPASPAALHLLAILAYRPPEVQPLLALPADPPRWLDELAGLTVHTQPTPATPASRLAWEQRTLPGLAHQMGAWLLHQTTSHPPLFHTLPCTVSPTGPITGPPRERSLAGRLRSALAQGGLARTKGVFWPTDLPSPEGLAPLYRLPPIVHPDFVPLDDLPHSPPAQLDLPETFILCHGPFSPRDLRCLIETWTWAAGSIGQLYPLVVLGADPLHRERIQGLCSDHGLGDQVHVLPDVSPGTVPAIYQSCSSFFHPAPASPWGGAVRHALACGKPVVAIESPLADALVGPAAFLLPAQDTRKLGAALITTVVDREVAGTLSAAARRQTTTWRSEEFGVQLADAYQLITNPGG